MGKEKNKNKSSMQKLFDEIDTIYNEWKNMKKADEVEMKMFLIKNEWKN